MTYTDFNKYIHDFCLKPENIGETIILSIDDSIIKSFCEDFNTTAHELQTCIRRKFHFGWSLALKNENDIPQFFGLLAVQVYVAHLMHNDEEYTAAAYNPRLSMYLNESQPSLQSLYREHQDGLWQALKNWGLKKNVTFLIPTTDIKGWRFVKYPISQALLNQEDLKKLPLLFQGIGLRSNESVSFDDFKQLINQPDKVPGLTRHYQLVRNKLRELGKEDSVLYQIYDYYSKWDGSHYISSSDEENRKTHATTERELSYIVLDNSLLFFDLFNHRDERLARCSVDDSEFPQQLFTRVHSSHNSLVIFERDKFYDSWVNTRFLSHGQKHLILSKKGTHLEVAISQLDIDFRKVDHPVFSAFEVNVSTAYEPTGFWSQYFAKRKRPFKLLNGLLLNRNVWMLGQGPTIHFYNESKAWLNSSRIEMDSTYTFSCKGYAAGDYRLKVSGFAPVSFSIKKAQNNYSIEPPTGWQLDVVNHHWRPGQLNFIISGLCTSNFQEISKAPIRDWLHALTSRSNKSESDIIVVKAIQRKRHGHLFN